MALNKLFFMILNLFSIITFKIVSAPLPTHPMVAECRKNIKIFCESKNPNAILCANAVILKWRTDDPFVIMNMKDYHLRLIRKMFPGDFKMPENFCTHAAGLNVEYNEHMKCKRDLAHFGREKDDIFNYAVEKTSIYDERYGKGHYAIEYLEHIAKKLILKTRMKEPLRYCKDIVRLKKICD